MAGRLGLYAAVGAGGALGSAARYGVSLALAGAGFPWGTLAVNALGSFLIGLYFAGTDTKGEAARPFAGQFVMGGFCGGFTTFSIFSLEALRLAQEGAWGRAGAFVGGSLILWSVSVWLGHEIGTRARRARTAG